MLGTDESSHIQKQMEGITCISQFITISKVYEDFCQLLPKLIMEIWKEISNAEISDMTSEYRGHVYVEHGYATVRDICRLLVIKSAAFNFQLIISNLQILH